MTKDDKSKDAPAADAKATPELNITKGKIKKNKKKKKHTNKSESSMSSSSLSEGGSAPPLVLDELAKEQFYDAHESYYGLTAAAENTLLAASGALTPSATPITPVTPAVSAVPAAPAMGTALLVARSEHGQDPKISLPGSVTPSATAKKAPSTVTKPVTGPD